MKALVSVAVATGLAAATAMALAQQPSAKAKGAGNQSGADGVVSRMMAFDANGDGSLTKEEVTDERLHRLFDARTPTKTEWFPSRN